MGRKLLTGRNDPTAASRASKTARAGASKASKGKVDVLMQKFYELDNRVSRIEDHLKIPPKP